jgi:hypothetical protein
MGDPINGIDPRGRQTCFYVNGELDSCEDDDVDPLQDPDSKRRVEGPGAGGSSSRGSSGGAFTREMVLSLAWDSAKALRAKVDSDDVNDCEALV